MAIEVNQRYYMKLKAAYYYYERGMTQVEISELLHVSRLTLGRLLREAREEGIVNIQIVDHRGVRHCLEAEADLRDRFGLRDAKVVECIRVEDGESLNRQIGIAAAKLVEELLQSGMRIGIGWGRTLEQMTKSLHPNPKIRNLEVVTLLGGASTVTTMIQPNNLVQLLLQKYDGKGYVINAPYICQTEGLCRAMKAEPGVGNALSRSLSADITLIGVGEKPSWDHSKEYYQFEDAEISILQEHGAVGDICAHFFDQNGKLCDTSICRRVVSIDPQELKAHKLVVMMGGGVSKREAVLGALRGGYMDILVTDYDTACSVLEASGQ